MPENSNNEFEQTMKNLKVKKLDSKNKDKEDLKKKSRLLADSIQIRRQKATCDINKTAFANVTSEEVLEFYDKLTKDEKNRLRLKKNACAKLDLHNYKEDAAIEKLDKKLIELSKRKDCKFLEVIHGKAKSKNPNEFIENYPVIKNAVNQTLRNRNFVKGFCSQLLGNGKRNPGSTIVMLNIK